MHIFISYSKHNSDYAYTLADFLQENGFDIWIDRIRIEYGVDWWAAIVQGLKGCGALIVVMTPESRQSDWVKREVFIALEDEKPVFPLLLNGENWELFVLTQYVDVRDGALPDGDLLKRLGEYVTPRSKGFNTSSLTPEKQAEQPPQPAAPAFDIDRAIADFRAAFRAKAWSEALNILGRIRASGEDPNPFDPDEFERRVQGEIERENQAREREQYEAERERQYERLQVMADLDDGAAIWTALQKFWGRFPDYDPDNLARFQPAPVLIKPRSSIDLLPAPFAWIDIPAGKVGKGAPYKIAKYPLTNAQYRLFVDAGGYNDEQWWTEAGWVQRQQEGWTEPRYWTDSKWNAAEQPVVGVSWYEGVAYCQWLSSVTGEAIMLPTEAQWQYAAQGDDGREYPWGSKWDGSRCNNNVDGKGVGRTTPVRQYEGKGDSPFGAVDMAGNVWEWCRTSHENKSDSLDGMGVRVLRGGSWFDLNTDLFLCDFHDGNYPHKGTTYRGFRLARS
ncbi:MAG: SUMF1/EgtB/PvdO family nonheme iron enzyme [Anaerolineae bacterium]|nr:SUMF1/EgtB/PvdO family nonheme iron enzyme [Anaerolineae bacterium]